MYNRKIVAKGYGVSRAEIIMENRRKRRSSSNYSGGGNTYITNNYYYGDCNNKEERDLKSIKIKPDEEPVKISQSKNYEEDSSKINIDSIRTMISILQDK